MRRALGATLATPEYSANVAEAYVSPDASPTQRAFCWGILLCRFPTGSLHMLSLATLGLVLALQPQFCCGQNRTPCGQQGPQQDPQEGFRKLVVPVTIPPSERPFATGSPAIFAWIKELESPEARRRAAARAWLSKISWRHAHWMRLAAQRAGAEALNAEKSRALAAIVRRLRDRRYNGESPESQVNESQMPARKL